MFLSTGPALGAQDTGNKSYILALGPHLEPKTPATNRKSQHWCPIWSPRHWQQPVHLSTGDPTYRPRHRQLIVHLSPAVPLGAQDTGSKSSTLALRPHLKPKTPATNRRSQHRGPTCRPRHRQQVIHVSNVHVCTGAPLGAQDTGNDNSDILALGPHLEPKTLATNRAS